MIACPASAPATHTLAIHTVGTENASGVARALDLVGQRWALLLVRELLPGPRRFTDLLLPGLTPNVLSTRLKELEAAGLVEAVTLPPPARAAWALTDAGRRLEPVILALGEFGSRYLGQPRPDDHLSSRWLAVSLQRRYRGDLDGVVVQLVIDGVPYALRFEGGRLRTLDGVAPSPVASLSGSLSAVAPSLARGEPLGPGVAVDGDPRVVQQLLEGLGRPG